MAPPDTPERLLSDARDCLRDFERSVDVEQARAVLGLLTALPSTARGEGPDLRGEALQVWLALLVSLERAAGTASDVPSRRVQPPPTRDGVVAPPGIQPERIDDPEARREYEAAIAANEARIERYLTHDELRRLAEQTTVHAAVFVANAFPATDPQVDRATALRFIEAAALGAGSRATLLEALSAA
jgi:hypothetical protein